MGQVLLKATPRCAELKDKPLEFTILRAAVDHERAQWSAATERLPADRRDVYFLPEYLRPYEKMTGGEACCAVCTAGDALLLYPFLKSTIALDDETSQLKVHDIQSAYGYGGPVVNPAGEAAEFLQEAWSKFAAWCAIENVVSEFVRFHPLLDNVRWAPKAMKTFEDRITIPIALGRYPDNLVTSSYYRAHRQMLNKAERSGFTFHVMPAQNELAWFVPLYQETQEFLQAGNDTRFGMEYFSSLVEGFDTMAWLGVVKRAGEITVAVLVLEGPTYLHSHLMGYRRNMQTAGMTNLVYHGIALEGAKRGKTIMHMGGGRNNSGEDSLFRFKKSLSPARAHFWLGTNCHDQQLYNELASRWEIKHGPRPGNYLQFYKLQGPIHTV